MDWRKFSQGAPLLGARPGALPLDPAKGAPPLWKPRSRDKSLKNPFLRLTAVEG